MSTRNDPSLGSLPTSLLSTGGGFSEPIAGGAVTETEADQAIKKTTGQLAAGLRDPGKDDELIAGCHAFGQLVRLRVQPATPLRDVAHPSDAETLLVPTAEQAVLSLQQEPTTAALVPVDPLDLGRRVVRLQRTRRLRLAFVSLVDCLDLVIRNYEDSIDGDLRTIYRNTASLIENHPRFSERFGFLKFWATRNGQRSAEARRRNARRDAARDEDVPAAEPLPAPAPPAPAVAAPVPAAPLPIAARGGRPPAPAPRRRTRR